jgi:hypothetical protein
MATTPPAGRDIRLDVFRGVALWLIYLDHIPYNIVNWITIRNYGFSDAADMFVFISGYTAAFVYGRAMRDKGTIAAGARILKRAWQIYVAHVFLFVIYLAEIAYLGAKFDNPLFAEEFNVFGFLRHPDVTLVQGLLLKFKPVNMDVLPLYIVLMLTFPPVLWALLRRPNYTLLASIILYFAARHFGWNLPGYPLGKWYFNPFCWQLLFVFGAWCGLGGAKQLGWLINSRVFVVFAAVYLVFAMIMTLAGHFHWLAQLLPSGLYHWVTAELSKTNLDPLRFLHFIILAGVVVHFVPRDWPPFRLPVFRPAEICGQHSLEIFCFGIFLSFGAHFVLVQMTNRAWMQIVISLVGIALMIGLAYVLSWFKQLDKSGPKPAQAAPLAADRPLAGGTA